MPISIGEKIFDGKLSWPNSAAANTERNADLASGVSPQPDNELLVLVQHPSTVTALTLKPRILWTDSDAIARISQLGANLAIVANTVVAFRILGLVVAQGFRLSFSNDTVLGVADTFEAHIQVWLV